MSSELSTEAVKRVWCKAHNLHFDDMVFENKDEESTKVVCLSDSGDAVSFILLLSMIF